MPMNIATARPPSIARVVAALRDFGLRNAGTPLLMASTPVSAAQPEENALATRKIRANPMMSPCSDCSSKPADSAFRSWPRTWIWKKPHASIRNIPTMKAYVGMANAVPDSRMPRRLIAVSKTMAVTAKITLCWAMNGTAEPMLDIAEAIDTATVST